MKQTINKILLFLVSYIPLYLILLIREILKKLEKIYALNNNLIDSVKYIRNLAIKSYYNELTDIVIIVMFVIIIFTFISFSVLLWRTEKIGGKSVKIINCENETDKHLLSYISLYLVSCAWISLNSIADVFTLVTITFIIGYIYVTNNLMYINPILSIVFKYRVYMARIKFPDCNEIVKKIIISKAKELQPNQIIDLVDSEYLYAFHVGCNKNE